MNLKELKKKIPDIFERVKRDVKKVLNRRRAGLNLAFVNMGMSSRGFIGGMFFSGGTMIIMNNKALEVLLREIKKDPDQQEDIALDYVYHVLMHEYLHSLGFLDEKSCRDITLFVTKKLGYPKNHPVRQMAEKGIGVYFPNMVYAPEHYNFKPNPAHLELIPGFDKSNTIYYM